MPTHPRMYAFLLVFETALQRLADLRRQVSIWVHNAYAATSMQLCQYSHIPKAGMQHVACMRLIASRSAADVQQMHN